MPKDYLRQFVRRFKGKGRAEVGPMTMTSVVRKTCNIGGGSQNKLLEHSGSKNSCNLTVAHPNLFYPFRPYQV